MLPRVHLQCDIFVTVVVVDVLICCFVYLILHLSVVSVALQFPEGLLMFATTISDIIERYVKVAHPKVSSE